MSQAVTVRIAEPAWEELRSIAEGERRSISDVSARLIDEGLRQSRFPNIEFLTFNGERQACIKGALQVWQIIMIARDLAMNVEMIAGHLDLKPDQVRCGLRYYEEYAAEIDNALSENELGFEKLKAILPDIHLVTVDASEPEGERG